MSEIFKRRISKCKILMLMSVIAILNSDVMENSGITEPLDTTEPPNAIEIYESVLRNELKNYMTWQEAYIDFIKKLHVTESVYDDRADYVLIYVDDDDIPELYIFTGGMASGEIIVSFYDGKIGTMNRERIGMMYMERGGLLYSGSGAMGFYPCNIYKLERGEFSEIGTGWCSEYADEQGNISYAYYWESSAVTETEYEAYIEELIDTSECTEPSLLYSESEILELLMDWE